MSATAQPTPSSDGPISDTEQLAADVAIAPDPKAAAVAVMSYLEAHPDYPERLLADLEAIGKRNGWLKVAKGLALIAAGAAIVAHGAVIFDGASLLVGGALGTAGAAELAS